MNREQWLTEVGKLLEPIFLRKSGSTIVSIVNFLWTHLSNRSLLEAIPHGWQVICGFASFVLPVTILFLCRRRKAVPAPAPVKSPLVLPSSHEASDGPPPLQWKYRWGPIDRKLFKVAVFFTLLGAICVVAYELEGWTFLGPPVYSPDDISLIRWADQTEVKMFTNLGNEIRAHVSMDFDHDFSVHGDFQIRANLTNAGMAHCSLIRMLALKDDRKFDEVIRSNPGAKDSADCQFLIIHEADKTGVIVAEIQLRPLKTAQKFPEDADIKGWLKVGFYKWGQSGAGK